MTESTARYVETKAIQDAAFGHEPELLQAVGIKWNSKNGHIDCPYNDHGGASDWRWDHEKHRAHCTCIGRRLRERKTHDNFDVVRLIGGLDGFKAAKLRVAELLHRDDLIRTKKDVSARRGQMTAARLLSTPADRRDDTLPVTYLAHRLGVVARDVPIPTTPMVGLPALPYFDPSPKGSKAKQTLVGEYPCAVFGTVAADGGTHAHRIYLAAGGAGKADLGVGPNGQARDPKKSATAAAGDNTAGRAVLWGDPTSAPVRRHRERRGGRVGTKSRDCGRRDRNRRRHVGRRNGGVSNLPGNDQSHDRR